MQKRRIAVIGAGASGLPCIRHALLYDLDVTCFEASKYVGGLWRYKEGEEEASSVMKSTVINTSKEMTAYSDFPPLPQTPNFMHNTEMYKYLKRYADNYQLQKYIKFEHKVKNVLRTEDYRTTGKWKVIYVTPEGEEKTEIFDGVCMCSGHHSIPYVPTPWEGQEKFKGKIMHSMFCKNSTGYEDKTVIVVGVGNSGGDAAVELSRVCRKVYISARRGAWVFNRVFNYGQPLDMTLNRKYWYSIKKMVPECILNFALESILTKRFDHAQYGLKPDHHVLNAHQTINDDLPNKIACGSIVMKPIIKRFTENSVEFTDGSSAEDVDAVILATGFNFEFNLCEGGTLFRVVENQADLYLNMFPLETADHNSLAIIGLIQPFGSIAPVSEMQARVFMENFAGTKRLPSKANMKLDIMRKQHDLKTRYVNSRRHTIQIEYIDYMDELSSLIGAKPEFLQLLIRDPALAFKAEFGPRVSTVYRLQGPHPWDGAENAIKSVDDRAYKANSFAPPSTSKLYSKITLGFASLISSLYFLSYFLYKLIF